MQIGFTLVELIVVILIIAILSALGLSQFGPAKERALDKEAVASLKLIQAAEKIYRMENYPYYYPIPPLLSESDIGNINANLKLSLPTDARRSWDYTAQSTGNAIASRCITPPCPPAPYTRTWTLPIDQEDPTCSGTCY